MSKKKSKRFLVENIGSDKMLMGTMIITDTETGVQYLYAFSGYGGGITPLIDAEGKPLIAPQNKD